MEGKTVSAGRLLHAVKPPGCRIRSGLETFKFSRMIFAETAQAAQLLPAAARFRRDCPRSDRWLPAVCRCCCCRHDRKLQIPAAGVPDRYIRHHSVPGHRWQHFVQMWKTVITCAEFIQVCNTIFKFQVGVTHGRKIQHFLTA